MVLIAGCLSVIYGIAAIDNSRVFTGEATLVFSDLSTWGWVHLIIGILQLIAAFSIWSRHMYGRIIGVATAAVSAIALLLFVNAFPWAAFGVFVIDMLVIYGLVVYGGDPDRAA